MKQDTVVISQQTLFEKIGTGKGCMGEMEINDNVPQGSLDQDGHVVGFAFAFAWFDSEFAFAWFSGVVFFPGQAKPGPQSPPLLIIKTHPALVPRA